MYKWAMIGLLFFPLSGLANVHTNQLVGKWQCHIKHSDPLVTQESTLQFFNNGTMSEQIRIYYGKKTDYHYQIESATAKSTWTLQQGTLHYGNHQFYAYAVRMPNANKHDLEQANIAVQKSLPMVKDMMDNQVNHRQFDVSFANKKSLIMNDIDKQTFTTCHKKWLFG